jgi:hypothetical protein
VNIAPFTPEGLLLEVERGRRDPYATARSYGIRQHPGGVLKFSGSSAGTTDIFEYAGPPYTHSLSDEGIGDERHVAAVPQKPHSDRMPDQLSGKRRNVTQTAGEYEAVPGRKRTPGKRKPCEFPDFTMQVCPLTETQEPTRIEKKPLQSPETPVAIGGATYFIKVPQTWYKTPARQEDWEEVAPIEFGGIKLTDAANQTWAGVPGYDDKVLDYRDVGSSILCRVNVRRTFQAVSHVISLTFIVSP